MLAGAFVALDVLADEEIFRIIAGTWYDISDFLPLLSFLCFFSIDLRLTCVCVVIGTTCSIIRDSLSWVASGIIGFARRE